MQWLAGRPTRHHTDGMMSGRRDHHPATTQRDLHHSWAKQSVCDDLHSQVTKPLFYFIIIYIIILAQCSMNHVCTCVVSTVRTIHAAAGAAYMQIFFTRCPWKAPAGVWSHTRAQKKKSSQARTAAAGNGDGATDTLTDTEIGSWTLLRAGLIAKNFANWHCSMFRCYLVISV
jgi:hypothetical protein